MQKIKTKDQVTNIFTKALSGAKFTELKDQLNMSCRKKVEGDVEGRILKKAKPKFELTYLLLVVCFAKGKPNFHIYLFGIPFYLLISSFTC